MERRVKIHSELNTVREKGEKNPRDHTDTESRKGPAGGVFSVYVKQITQLRFIHSGALLRSLQEAK